MLSVSTLTLLLKAFRNGQTKHDETREGGKANRNHRQSLSVFMRQWWDKNFCGTYLRYDREIIEGVHVFSPFVCDIDISFSLNGQCLDMNVISRYTRRGMYQQENNFAFIDSQNVNLGIRDSGWILDFKRFRVYLKEWKLFRPFLQYMNDLEKRLGYKKERAP